MKCVTVVQDLKLLTNVLAVGKSFVKNVLIPMWEMECVMFVEMKLDSLGGVVVAKTCSSDCAHKCYACEFWIDLYALGLSTEKDLGNCLEYAKNTKGEDGKDCKEFYCIEAEEEESINEGK